MKAVAGRDGFPIVGDAMAAADPEPRAPERSAHVLVVDDDSRLCILLRRFLQDHDYAVTAVESAAAAREQMGQFEFDAIVLDVMMPGEDGFSLTEAIRESRDTPILLLTAMDEVEHRIAGLERGADDYLPKPFEPRELLLRLQAILKRTRGRPNRRERVRFGGFAFDIDSGELLHGDSVVALTTVEAGLLQALARQAGIVMSRDELGSAQDLLPRTVDVQINRLRRKIEDNARSPRHLITIRGSGYMLRARRLAGG